MRRRWAFSVLALLCWITTVGGELKPEIVDEIIPEVTKQGGQAMLNCTVVNKGGNTVTWTFLDSKFGGEIISNDENIFINDNECNSGSTTDTDKKYRVVTSKYQARTTFTLIIGCLSYVDYGYYKCYVQIRQDPPAAWPSKIGYLVVQVPPTINSINDAVMQVDVGHAINLSCEATGVPKPNITWIRSDGGLLPGDLGALHNESNLVIKNVRKEDRGLYKCVADNQVRPPDFYSVSLSVFFRPETIAVQDTVGQAQNRQFDAKLECRVSGYPEPEVVWMREPQKNDGQRNLEQLNDNEKYDIHKQIATTTLRFQESWYTLRIKNVEANDYTFYYCVAINRIGTNDSTMIELFETMECQGANCPTFAAGGVDVLSVSLVTVATAALFSCLL